VKTKFNNSLKPNNKLFKLASKALKAKYHLLPILPSLKSNLENSKLKTKGNHSALQKKVGMKVA